MKLSGSLISSVKSCIEHSSIKIDSISLYVLKNNFDITSHHSLYLIDVFHKISYAFPTQTRVLFPTQTRVLFLTQTHVLLQPELKHLKHDVKCTNYEHLFA
jgi:hypothetical protein